ncbi:MAG: hypothetical protein ABIR08_11480 [Sphingomonas sp.]
MKFAGIIACALALFTSVAAFAQSSFVGDYRLADGPDVVGELILEADGRFQYALGAGALDEQAEGRWVEADGQVRLYTEPKPKPAVFAAGPQAATKDGPLKLLVTWPNGRGIAGVDFTIGFDSGEAVTDYTQDYGWTMSRDERRIPRWLELREPIHGVASPRFAIDVGKGNALTFVLTPNDLGVVDFDGTVLERVGDRVVMHQRLGDLTFVRSRAAKDRD